MNPEKHLLDYLSTSPTLPPTYMAVPPGRPTRFITLERTSGGMDDITHRAGIAIQAWEGSRSAACDLAHDIAEYLFGIEDDPKVAALSIDRIYNFPCPTSKSPRYQMVINITYQR